MRARLLSGFLSIFAVLNAFNRISIVDMVLLESFRIVTVLVVGYLSLAPFFN